MWPEGSSAISDKVRRVEELAQSAGCSTTARAQEEGPVIWEALPLLNESGANPGREGRPERGEPERGREGERGVGGPNRSEDAGERSAPGPGRAKAARVEVNFWRAT